MNHPKRLLFILIPAILTAQNNSLSETARKMMSKPRLDNAELTLSDGRKDTGRIVRVTDQFITLLANYKLLTCEDIDLSKVTAVHWLPTKKSNQIRDAIGVGILLSPFLLADAVADVFRGMSPPLQPLGGHWESGDGKSTLEFSGTTVKGGLTIARRGRYTVSGDQMHILFDGLPETVTRFRFKCGQLNLDNPPVEFGGWPTTHPASGPIVGEWHSHTLILILKADGSIQERKTDLRTGSFERTSRGVTIHWTDDQGPGGALWDAQIQHRHIVVRLGGVVTEYHYIPPSGFDL